MSGHSVSWRFGVSNFEDSNPSFSRVSFRFEITSLGQNTITIKTTNKILSLKRLYNYKIGIPKYKFSNNMIPESFEKHFSNVASVQEHDTRSACLNYIYVKFKGTTRGQKAFSNCGSRVWNCILSHIETDCAELGLAAPRVKSCAHWAPASLEYFWISGCCTCMEFDRDHYEHVDYLILIKFCKNSEL